MSVGSQMPELDRGAFLPPPPPYKIGSQNTPYKLELKYTVKPCFHARIFLVVEEIFVHKKRSDKICCPSKPVNRHLFGYQGDHQL